MTEPMKNKWSAIEVDRIRKSERAGVWAHLTNDAVAMKVILLRMLADSDGRDVDPIDNYLGNLALYEMGFLQPYQDGTNFRLRATVPEEVAKRRPIWNGNKVIKPEDYPRWAK